MLWRFALKCVHVQCYTCFNIISLRISKAMTPKTKSYDKQLVNNNKLYSCDYWIAYTWRGGNAILRFYRTICQFVYFQDAVGMPKLTSRSHEATHCLNKAIGSMLTSSNGKIFRVTGHLCGEFTGHRWIPHTKASDAELQCFLWSASE